MLSKEDVREFRQCHEALVDGLQEHVFGQRPALDLLVSCFLARGHFLLEGIPGTAKTMMLKLLSRLTGFEMARVQGTPDLMPADIIGSLVIDETGREPTWKRGPVFDGNFILIDEINRMNPRTQSVTLQAMQEGSVKYYTEEQPLRDPHMFMATMNPIEQEGTYPLPEAQLDRFTAKVVLPPPDTETLKRIISTHPDRHVTERTLSKIEPTKDWRYNQPDTLAKLKQTIDAVELSKMADEIASIVTQCSPLPEGARPKPDDPRKLVQFGGSPRGAQALAQLARVHALTQDREYVTSADLRWALVPALGHRVLLRYDVELELELTVPQFLQEKVQWG